MRVRSAVGFLVCGMALVFARPAFGQEWRGRARVEGQVTDDKGQPIAGATVSLRWTRSGQGGPDIKTDAKGRWVFFGLSGGGWNIEIQAPGFIPKKTGADFSEVERNPTIITKLDPAPKEAAPAGPATHEEFRVGGKTVSKETMEAIEKGNAAFQEKKFAEAREAYQVALLELPDSEPLIMRLSAAFEGEGNTELALKYARQATSLDATDIHAWFLVATIELQNGNLEAGKAALEKVPPEKVTNPEVYMNLGIVLFNKKKSAEAEVAFGKALAISPDLADAYYYRGLARLQQGHKADAKADFHKYLELAPNGSEAKDVKELLNATR
ncbi:MAG TPA: tetratricopeptide repeat protein [Thermoanaerobaculia bacterium]|nr:tetratricopeptide repeat protein [Thermoanaerobaculia bacterium]